VTIRDALRFADADASNYVAFKSSATVSSNITWTLPAADGTNGQLLSTNGSGTLSWATGGGGGSSITAGDSKVEVTDTGSNGKITGTADNTAVFSVEKGKTFVLEGGSSSTGVGVAFPATQVASTDANTLDDYEEGTWTPTYTASTGSFSAITYSTQGPNEGRYRKIGSIVYITGQLRTDSITLGTASGELLISGLPFTAINESGSALFREGLITGSASPFGTGWGTVPIRPTQGRVVKNTTTISLVAIDGSNGLPTDINPTLVGTGVNSNAMNFSGFYFTAS
jgi:hypothetical protein